MERPSGPPMGTATQSTGRSLVENGTARLAPLNTARKVPNTSNPAIRHAASSSSLSTHIPITSGQVIALAREAMKVALEENQTKAAEASGVSNELKPGVTIDMSHKNIQKFPEEVVDIIKNELERLALSHNQISSFPARFAECTSLRYLNARSNSIREFPLAICELTSLEILDLGRNKLRVLPPELVKLTSLKVLSVQKNRIEELPLCLADMTTLQVLKLDGNPIQFPPKEILQPSQAPPANDGFQESESGEISITSQIKKFLKQKVMADRSETESGGEESSEGTETPRPMKRVMSGRFPIKVNGTDMPDLRSPALPRAPPIPSRSHFRGLSQQNAAVRRPAVMPLTIGLTNERLRSNSENQLSASRDRVSLDRSRRMGIVSRKASELGTVDETKTNRYSHYRGLSHGSAMQGGKATNGTLTSRSPASPADSAGLKTQYVRRLSSLPERKRVSVSPDPVIEGATGILFALFQIHPLIQTLLDILRDATNKRTSLERVFYNASTHVEELDRDLQAYNTYSEEDEELGPRSNENVHTSCLACVGAYIHVCTLLNKNVDTLIANADPRLIRHLLLLVYGSCAEIRNASISLLPKDERSRDPGTVNGTTTLPSRDKSITPTRERPGTIPRNRSATVVQHPTNLRVATDARHAPYLNGTGRAATMTSATPRSGESFTSSISGGRINGEFTEEDRVFEKIFLRLQQSSENALRALPEVNNHFITAMTLNSQSSKPELPKQFWQIMIQKTQHALQNSEILKHRLSQIKLKEPGIRTQATFWELCNTFIQSYTDLVMKVKEAKTITSFLPTEVIILLRPLQKLIKETSQLIQASPWSYLATSSTSSTLTNGASAYNVQSPASQVPLPMTPQSAALGPAVQATVPSTPQSASYNAMFSGNVFERADAYLSMNGSSTLSSRTATMTSSTMVPSDGSITPAAILSPANSTSRFINGNGNGKTAF